jgi:hypothetical protein
MRKLTVISPQFSEKENIRLQIDVLLPPGVGGTAAAEFKSTAGSCKTFSPYNGIERENRNTRFVLSVFDD